MSFLSGNSDNVPQAAPKTLGLDNYRAATNEQARPIVYFAGKRRFALTWMSKNFGDRSVPTYQRVGKEPTKSGDNYFSSAAGLACSGPVDALFNVHLNSESVYAASVRIIIVSLTLDGTTATAETSAAHGLEENDEVDIGGAEQGEYNGTVTVTGTPSATTFTFEIIGTPVSPATGNITARLVLPPVYRNGDNPNSVSLLIPDYGNMHHYWGTRTQQPNEFLRSSGVAHPSYAGKSYSILEDFFIGFNQTNFPNTELTLGRWPKPASGWHNLGPIEDEVNPVAFICDLLQGVEYGYRVPDAKLNTAQLLATAAQLEEEGLGFSPFIDTQTDLGDVIMRALEYIDGYPTVDAQGRFGIKLARASAADLPILSDNDIMTPVKFDSEDWSEVKTGVTVKFTNREIGYLQDARQWRDAGALRIRGVRDVQTVDRLWFTRPEVASAFAVSLGRTKALPRIPGSVKLRVSGTLLADLTPGALFKFNLSNRNTTNLTFRVETLTIPDPARPEFQITFRVDRSYLFQPIL